VAKAPVANPQPVPPAPPQPQSEQVPPPASPVQAPDPTTNDWAFSSINLIAGEDSLKLVGELINGTGSAQKLNTVTASIFDGQGQEIADPSDIEGDWPVDAIPAGGKMPFRLTINDIQSAADYELTVDSEVLTAAPGQVLELSNVTQRAEGELFCLAGQLQDFGDGSPVDLVVVSILYDNAGNVIDFGDQFFNQITPAAESFKVCANAGGQQVARHSMWAWKQ
jgi:hypothetical protein